MLGIGGAAAIAENQQFVARLNAATMAIDGPDENSRLSRKKACLTRTLSSNARDRVLHRFSLFRICAPHLAMLRGTILVTWLLLDLRSAFLAVERRLVLLAGALIFFAAKCAQGKVTRRPVAGVGMLMPRRGNFYHSVGSDKSAL